jgi:heme/copper-type cytochrome/quinol oxidase subunit 1
MIRKYLQPETLFLVSGLLIVTHRLLFVRKPLDVAVHDTYIVVDAFHITFLITVMFMILSLPYSLFRKADNPLSTTGGWIHYVLTMLPLVVALIIIPLISIWYQPDQVSERRERNERYNMIIALSYVLCIFGQLVFLVNILVTLFKRKRSIQ